MLEHKILEAATGAALIVLINNETEFTIASNLVVTIDSLDVKVYSILVVTTNP